MPDFFRNPMPGTVTHLLMSRDEYFNTDERLVTQYAKALRHLHCFRRAKEAVQTHRTDFFGFTRMFDTAWLHDHKTIERWEKRMRMGLGGPVRKERFFRRRLLTGIRCIKRLKKKFDLHVPESQAFFGFYLQSLQWHLDKLLKEPQPVEDDCLDFSGGTDPPSRFEQGELLAVLAIPDLPRKQRPIARRIEAGGRLSHASDSLKQLLHLTLCNYRILISTHKLAQSMEGTEVIRNAVKLLKHEADRQLVLDHFTVAGPDNTQELFVGIPLDELANPKEKLDKTGDAVRRRLLKCLNAISSLLQEELYAALGALPRRQRSILNVRVFKGQLDDADEKLPDWTPAQWEVETRKAQRDLKYLHELYQRCLNGKSLHTMLNHVKLTRKERDLLEDHLVEPRKRRHTLGQIAAERGVHVEMVKEELLAAAKKVIKL